MSKEIKEPQPNSLQLEVREYGKVSHELIEIARSGIVQVLQDVQAPQTKPLRLHITEGGFQTLKGAGFIEVYLPRSDSGDIHIAYQGGYLQDTREQLRHNYGISAESASEYIWLYLACHSAAHYTQDLLGELQTRLSYKDIFYESSGPRLDQAYLLDPIEQEAHDIGLSAARKISIEVRSVLYQATPREANSLVNYPISFSQHI